MMRVAISATGAVVDGQLEAAVAHVAQAVRVRAARAERVSRLALAAAGRALADAGRLALEGEPRPSWGIALGTAFGCFLTNAAYQRRLALDGVRLASPRLFAATVSNAAAGEVSIACRLGGPAVTLTAGGAAGLLAIGHGADLVADGRADVVVAGGVDARGDDLERWLRDGGLGRQRPSMREGAGMVVLESSPDGQPVGWLAGQALGYSARGDPDHAAALVSRALEDAGVSGTEVDRVALVGAPAGAPPVVRGVRAVLGGAQVVPPSPEGEAFAAAGPLALIEALETVPAGRPAVVLQLCPSGHAAALVVARAAP
jgi:3-oxoacyl-[acyl-carrier-protein] synthase II